MDLITELPKTSIAGRTEKGANFARVMVVINIEPLRLRAADGAAAFLTSRHLVELANA
jgi:hypothetical protein